MAKRGTQRRRNTNNDRRDDPAVTPTGRLAMHPEKALSKQCGVTLIELMIVIVILAVIAKELAAGAVLVLER